MSGKKLIALLVGSLVIGLLAGGLFTDLRWRQRSAEVAREVADLQARLAEAESRIKQLTGEFNAERQRREALEQVLSEGRK